MQSTCKIKFILRFFIAFLLCKQGRGKVIREYDPALDRDTSSCDIYLYLDDATEAQKEEFKAEIDQMKLLGFHQNIVSLVGCCTHQEHMFLVIEYVPFGDMLQWLRRRRRMVGNIEN